MKSDQDLTYMASIYMALADKTRLRLLDMMRDGEICVGSFTDSLGESQPKVSRHLAYLRNAGIVDARRDGKWIHYSIRWPDDPGGRDLIKAALAWVSNNAQSAGVSDVAARPTVAAARRKTPTRQQDDLIYAEPNLEESTISDREYEPSHNELDDFLL